LLLTFKVAVAMMLVNVPIPMGVVGHDAGFPALRAANLEQDRVLDRPRAGAPVDDLHVVGPRNRMDALAILVHDRKLSAASATADHAMAVPSCATVVPPSDTETTGFSRKQSDSKTAWRMVRKRLRRARFGSISGGGGIRTHETPYDACGRAASYADVCRSPETHELLRAWEAEDPAAWETFRDLLDGSGIEPPDTDLLAWGGVMGLEEARVREQVATALEEAIEVGDLTPGARGFRRRQAEVVEAALHQPWDGDDGRSCLKAVHNERLERWLQRGPGRDRDARGAIVDRVAAVVSDEPPPIDPDAARSALEPTLWLLEQAEDGIALTQTGALNRALVREVAERWPSWWAADLFGPPHREDDVTPLCS
jgi:hypothetical protein